MHPPRHDIAQICLNGHVATKAYGYLNEFRRAYCEDCGEQTIVACQKCSSPIIGANTESNLWHRQAYHRPSYCHNCGKSFPWTERQIQAAIELFAEECQDEADRKTFNESVAEMAKDTPQAAVASTRFVKLLKKMTETGGEIVKKFVVDVASKSALEAMKHM